MEPRCVAAPHQSHRPEAPSPANAVKPRHVVEFAVGEQPGIGRDRGTTKLQHQTAAGPRSSSVAASRSQPELLARHCTDVTGADKVANTAAPPEESFGGVRTLGNPPIFEGHAIIAFVDLLGFSDRVKADWTKPGNPPLQKLLRIKETAAAARQTTLAVDPQTPGFAPGTHPAFRARIHTVSDSLIVCAALPPLRTSGDDFMYRLWPVVIAVQHLWGRAVQEGFTVRGGVELGQIYWTAEDTIGPALVDAYSLENKCANWSRVIVGPALLRFIAQIPLAYPYKNRSFLDVSKDDLIEINPAGLSLPKLEAIAVAAGEKFSKKYQPLLATLRGERKVREPGEAELRAAADKLSGQVAR